MRRVSTVVVITTGGTIASRPGANGGLQPRDSGAQLVAALQDTGSPSVEVVDLLSARSFALTHRDLRLSSNRSATNCAERTSAA